MISIEHRLVISTWSVHQITAAMSASGQPLAAYPTAAA